jgi:beta-lactamase superfamily II metal-dependent hydrolase
VSNFVANFTSVPTTDNRSTVVSLVISQNNPAYICNGVQINGITQTINWENSIEPTGNISNTDLITFTLIRTNNTWLVTGSLSTHGEI